MGFIGFDMEFIRDGGSLSAITCLSLGFQVKTLYGGRRGGGEEKFIQS